ncbi:MAG TPA: CRISPR-associated endonuclease Cas1 [Gammaproteobacteria bacterium]|nr:CRISPR-associated endonuclease Cas1 [Gammaproteobacteria bacterium]
MILTVDRKNTTIGYATGCLLVERAGEARRRIPLEPLELVILHGAVMISTGALRALASAGVATVALPGNGRQQPAHVGAGLAAQLPFRRLQYRCAENPERAGALAAWFVQRKLQAATIPLDTLRDWTGDNDACDSYAQAIERASNKLHRPLTAETIRGIEGGAARAWFALLASQLPPSWKFTGRNRRPPRDPVNALLSLGYTLLHSEVRHQLIGWGLDPALGYLHEDYPGRESLALDFCEPFRAGVDQLVLKLLRNEQLQPEDFYYREREGCRLGKKARPRFFAAWAEQRENWPRSPQEDNETREDTPLRQQIGGLIQQFRQRLKALENTDG